MLKVVFGFAEHQEKATFGLGCKLTLTRSKDDVALNKNPDIADGKIKLIMSTGIYHIIHHPFNNKAYYLIRL